HGCLAFLVELYDALLVELFQGKPDHADGSFDNAGSGSDHRIRLLSAQHRLGDFWGIGQMADADLDDLEPRDHYSLGDLTRELDGNDVGRPPQGCAVLGGVVVG